MRVPCVRVTPEEGEATRRELADADLIDRESEITVEGGWLYIPVSDPDAVPPEFEVVEHEVEPRDTQTMPADLLDFEPTYERLGDIVLLDEEDPERAREAAVAFMESDLPVRTVAKKASEVRGEERVREWEVLAGDGTETVHREYGCEFAVDIAQVYFSPRLATERHRVVEQVTEGESAFDMFAGVGPFAIPMAKRGAEVVAVDVNEVAIEYLKENARHNGVEGRVTAICGDVRDVVSGPSGERNESDGVREATPDYEGWADRIVMNLPHSAEEFVDTAVTIAGEECILHYYDIQDEDDPFGPGEAAIRDAAEPTYAVDVETRRVVRSYSPHEVNVCLDVRLVRA